MNQKLRGFLMTISLGPPLKTFIKLDSWALFGIISLCCSRVAGGVFGRKYQVKRWCPGSFSKTTLWSTWRLAFGDGCLKASFFPRSHEHFQTGVCWGIFFFLGGDVLLIYFGFFGLFFLGGKTGSIKVWEGKPGNLEDDQFRKCGLYCWWKKSRTSWGWWFIPLFFRVYTSQVVQEFFHQQYFHCYDSCCHRVQDSITGRALNITTSNPNRSVTYCTHLPISIISQWHLIHFQQCTMFF